MHKISGVGATADNEFTQGNPATAIPATVVTPEWLNAVQREVVAPIEQVGIALDAEDDKQLMQSVALHVENVAALRALAVPQIPAGRTLLIYLRGYYTAGDGGGGVVYWQGNSNEADNGGTVFQPNSLPAAGRWKLSWHGSVSAKQFGAKGDGVQDDAPKINAAMTYTGQVRLPRGGYRIGSPLSIGNYACLIGEDRTDCFLLVEFGAGEVANFDTRSAVIMSYGAKLKGLSFLYTQQNNAGAIVAYPPSIYLTGYYCEVEDINLINSYIGIYADASAFKIDNVIGFPYSQGLYIYRAVDIPKITNVHFNPNSIWNYDGRYGWGGVHSQQNIDWTKANGRSFTIGRCDFSHFKNWFSIYYNIGILLETTADGSAEACFFEQCHVDVSKYPLKVVNFENIAAFTNCKFVSVGNADGYTWVQGGSTNADLVFDTCYFDNSYTHAVRVVAGANLNIKFSKCKFTDFNLINGGYNCVYLSHDRTTVFDNCTWEYNDAVNNSIARCVFNDAVTSTTAHLVLTNNRVIRTNGSAEFARNLGGLIYQSNNDFTKSTSSAVYSSINGNLSLTQTVRGTAAPTSGTWGAGDIVYNATPTPGGFIGWVCTSGGTPGTWKTFGAISA